MSQLVDEVRFGLELSPDPEVLDTAQDDVIEDPSLVKRQKITDSHSINSEEKDFVKSAAGSKVLKESEAVEEEVVQEPVVVESAKCNMMEHIVATASRSAIKFNAQLRNQRKLYTRLFKLDAKKQAVDRETLSRSQNTFLHNLYHPGQNFVQTLNAIKTAE